MLSIGIVGGTGYTGVELMRLLARHPQAHIRLITSRTEVGVKVSDMFPNLRGHVDLTFTAPTLDKLAECEVLFFATPNGTAMQMVPELLKAGVKVIDLAADFRLKDPILWQQWYGMPHQCPELLEEVVYGSHCHHSSSSDCKSGLLSDRHIIGFYPVIGSWSH